MMDNEEMSPTAFAFIAGAIVGAGVALFFAPRPARLLNDEGRPAPRNSQGRKVSWSPSSVRSVLFRSLYLGEVIWNKTKKRNPWGIQQQKKRPEKDWVRIALPQLQISRKRVGRPRTIAWLPAD